MVYKFPRYDRIISHHAIKRQYGRRGYEVCGTAVKNLGCFCFLTPASTTLARGKPRQMPERVRWWIKCWVVQCRLPWEFLDAKDTRTWLSDVKAVKVELSNAKSVQRINGLVCHPWDVQNVCVRERAVVVQKGERPGSQCFISTSSQQPKFSRRTCKQVPYAKKGTRWTKRDPNPRYPILT